MPRSLLRGHSLISARRVLEKLIPVEQEVQTVDDRWYSLRIVPYRTLDNNIAGVVVSFVDINRIKAALQYAEDIINNIREPLIVLNENMMVISASRAFYKIFQVKPEDTAGQILFKLGNRQWDIPTLKRILVEVLEKNSIFEDYRVEHDFPGIGRRTMLLNARRIFNGEAARSVLLAMEDITDRQGFEPFSLKKEPGKPDPD
jgi:two-component system, chemotaxis family, CheB/CheR fusion protein